MGSPHSGRGPQVGGLARPLVFFVEASRAISEREGARGPAPGRLAHFLGSQWTRDAWAAPVVRPPLPVESVGHAGVIRWEARQPHVASDCAGPPRPEYKHGGRTTEQTEELLLAQIESFARPERMDGRGFAPPSCSVLEGSLARQPVSAAAGLNNGGPALVGYMSPVARSAVCSLLWCVDFRVTTTKRSRIGQEAGAWRFPGGAFAKTTTRWRATTVFPTGAKPYEDFWWATFEACLVQELLARATEQCEPFLVASLDVMAAFGEMRPVGVVAALERWVVVRLLVSRRGCATVWGLPSGCTLVRWPRTQFLFGRDAGKAHRRLRVCGVSFWRTHSRPSSAVGAVGVWMLSGRRI